MSALYPSTDSELAHIVLERVPLIDVRAPLEFASGKIPGASNLPLLDDDQRAAIGTEFKQKGADAAVALGRLLISGKVRDERLERWATFARENPGAWLYCFRGGMRSQLSAAALAEAGVRLPVLRGGYKRFRNFAISVIERASLAESFVVLTGFTGAGKTELLREHASKLRLCDLEKAAHHRGSAFGSFTDAQPAQADFENELAAQLVRLGQAATDEGRPIVLEDESRLIGRSVIPAALFARMTSAPLIVLECPRPERARRIISAYLIENYGLADGMRDDERIARLGGDLRSSLNAITRRLGGETTKSLLAEVDEALTAHAQTGSLQAHQLWVERLLEVYYDPLYLHHIAKQDGRVILRGTAEEVAARLGAQP